MCRFGTGVYFGFCAQTPVCPAIVANRLHGRQTTESFAARITWNGGAGGVRIVGYEPIAAAENVFDHLPWLDARLEFASGKRVTVAASTVLAARISATLAAADAAAAVADNFAHWVRPTRYVVYLASPAEFLTWFSGPRIDGKDILGYAAPTSRSSDVVVLNMGLIDAEKESVADVLRHEFGHVVTLLGTDDRTLATRLLVEGIAEYVEMSGRPIAAYGRLRVVTQFVRGGGWDGNIEQLANVPYDGSLREVNIMYGMGFLVWRCIEATFGMAKLFDFAGQALRERSYDVDDSSRMTLGQPWSAVKTTCANYIRTVTR
jgi:hypothetical protein